MILPWASLLFTLAAAPQARSSPYAEELVAAARAQGLWRQPEWLKLGHYDKGIGGGYASEAAGASFFLAPDGKTNPQAELDATIRGLFSAPSQCQFPARFAWLNSQLRFDPSRLPLYSCPKFEAFWARVQARSVTLVFSSYYLNNPSSAFGHTFLRLNKTEAPRGEKRFELLDYGVDYAATVDTHNAVLYAVKGLFGLFPGHFNHYPYFYKVREYNDYESRDLWEYGLNLTPGQLAMLVAHLWELGSTYFDYFYVTKNCSYQILGALEVANPALHLLSETRYVAVPADTVKALFKNPGLVQSVHYRPSIRSQFRARAERLNDREQQQVALLAQQPSADFPPGFSPSERARVLDATLDLLDFHFAKELVDAVHSPASVRKQTLMERRSELGVPSEPLEVSAPGSRPDEGHGSMRLSLGGGYSSQTHDYAELGFRLALHDLNDAPRGYPELASMEFLPTLLRFNERGRRVWLEDFSLVKVISLTDVDAFDQQVTWKARLGANTVRDRGCRECLEGIVEGGGGLTKRLFNGHLTLAGTVDGEVGWSPRLNGIEGSSVRAGVGPSGIVRLSFAPRFTALFMAEWRYLPLSHPDSRFLLSASPRLHLGHALSVGLDWRKVPLGFEAGAVVLAYF